MVKLTPKRQNLTYRSLCEATLGNVFQPEKGLIDNPSRLLEKVSGMPLRDIQRFTTQRKDKIESGERYKQPKVGY